MFSRKKSVSNFTLFVEIFYPRPELVVCIYFRLAFAVVAKPVPERVDRIANSTLAFAALRAPDLKSLSAR